MPRTVEVDALGHRLDSKIDTVTSELRRELGTVGSRVHTVLYGIIIAILVPILIRVFFLPHQVDLAPAGIEGDVGMLGISGGDRTGR